MSEQSTKENQIEQIAILVGWEKYATVKRWFKRLKMQNRHFQIPEGSMQAIKGYFPRYCTFLKKNPDDLIIEALEDNEVAEGCLRAFYNHLVSELSVPETVAYRNVYGSIRGFYSHNKVNTVRFSVPEQPQPKISRIDSNHLVFERKRGKWQLKKDKLREFLDTLNNRDRLIAICMMSTSADFSELRKLTVGFIKDQPIERERLFWEGRREKNGNPFKRFFTMEITKMLRQYIGVNRRDAKDDEPIFVISAREQLKKYKRDNGLKKGDPVPEDAVMPKVAPSIRAIDLAFRDVWLKISKKPLPRGEWGPFRPKRFRHIFRTSCSKVSIDEDIRNVFMGHQTKGKSSANYLDTAMEDLLEHFKSIEPLLTVYDDVLVDSETQEMLNEIEEHEKQIATKGRALSGLNALVDEMEDADPETLKKFRNLLLGNISE